VLMIRGGNARQVVEAVKAKVEDLQQSNVLPAGTKLTPFYDRIELVTAAIDTVRDALIEGIVLVVFVFFFFLGHVRSAIVVTVTLIVTPQEALALNWAIKTGVDLVMTLRAPGDTSADVTTSVTLQYLFDTYVITVPAKQPYGLEPRLDELIVPVLPNDPAPAGAGQ